MRYRACPLRRNACSGRSAAVVERDEATVRDGDAMGVAGEIGKHCFWPGEGRLGVDEPSLPLERCETCGEGLAAMRLLPRPAPRPLGPHRYRRDRALRTSRRFRPQAHTGRRHRRPRCLFRPLAGVSRPVAQRQWRCRRLADPGTTAIGAHLPLLGRSTNEQDCATAVSRVRRLARAHRGPTLRPGAAYPDTRDAACPDSPKRVGREVLPSRPLIISSGLALP